MNRHEAHRAQQRRIKIRPTDISVEDHGSLVLLHPDTPAAEQWFEEHIPEDAQWVAGALVVEPRYVLDILKGAISDGLVVRRAAVAS